MDEALPSVLYEVTGSFPEYSRWVAHDNTVPLEILERLAEADDMTRQVSRKNESSRIHYLNV